ncbi:solute carrier family 22 member 5-like [Clupea harengus]|uniref:Solute carrier family 22 member 5-like n=1 Tax=Clupea harengus TaxID=7950 RepID=A0A8M1KYQ0_CLUHA|nr:solute carrier family 22 member 5-like [Clupea harengus]
MRDFDQITAFLGEWGPYQKLIFILLSLSSIPNGYVGMTMVFLADIPPHHCRLPFLNSSYGGLGYNLSIPTEEVKGEIILSRCRRYTEQGDSDAVFRNDTEGCLDGWVFSKERYVSTIVTEWDLVCDHEWKTPFSVTVFFFGVLAGSLLSGMISDRYGRKFVFFATMAVQTVFSLIQAASNSWEMFCVLYFIVGLGQIANYCAAFILGCELLSKSYRITFATLGISMAYAVGYACLPLFAYFIRDWRMLLVALSVPGLLYIPLWWYIPESPRWLLSQGRVEEAEAIIRAAARKNGITPPDFIFKRDDTAELMEKEDVDSQKKCTWLDLLRTTNIRNITILNIIIWSIVSLTYYGLSLNTPNMDGDPYLNCLLASGTEFVGYMMMWLAGRYISRRLTLSTSVLFCGIMLLLIKLVPAELGALSVTLAMFGKISITGAFVFIYLYGIELLPTVVRNMGLGVTTMASRIGSCFSPYIAYMGTYNKALPYIIMGCISIICAILSLLLPETKDEELPEYISQVKPLQWC